MTTKRINFVRKYYQYAKAVQDKTGFPVSSILAQCAIETGDGATIVGNMMFGVKDTDGINGNEQLLCTQEQSTNGNLKYRYLLKKVKVGNIYTYYIKAYFRKYATPEESFFDHANFILTNRRYSKALKYKDQPTYFSREIARAGYATGVDYERIFISITYEIYNWLQANNYEQ